MTPSLVNNLYSSNTIRYKSTIRNFRLSQGVRNGLTAFALVSFVVGVYYTALAKMMQKVGPWFCLSVCLFIYLY
jgi:hypothetical protein